MEAPPGIHTKPLPQVPGVDAPMYVMSPISVQRTVFITHIIEEQ